MMKNTEWGAVAYLQHSKYGSRQSVRVNNNSSYLTGYAATEEPSKGGNDGASISGNSVGTGGNVTKAYNTDIGYSASTTSNISGIYDIAGGGWEYVMGYNAKASTIGGKSKLIEIYPDFFTNEERWGKYYDKYSCTNTQELGYLNRILGDATGEMGPFFNETDLDKQTRHRSSWYNDYARFVIPASPWIHRGGYYAAGTGAGMFSFYYNDGTNYPSGSFRVALAP